MSLLRKPIDSNASTVCPRAWSSSTEASTFRLPSSRLLELDSLYWPAPVIVCAKGELSQVKERQRNLAASRTRRLAELRAEADHIRAGEFEFLVHALVVPAQDPKEVERYDAEVEAIAVKIVTAYEESYGAKVKDVSRPDLARRAGLTDWPGFDLLSFRTNAERRAIEVKGRAGTGGIELSENEWAKACNLP